MMNVLNTALQHPFALVFTAFLLYVSYEILTHKPKPLPVLEVGKAKVTITTDGKSYDFEFVGKAWWNDAFGDVSDTAEMQARRFINGKHPVRVTDTMFLSRHQIYGYVLKLEPFSTQAQKS